MGILRAAMAWNLRQLIVVDGMAVTYIKRTTLTGANPAPNPLLYEGLKVDGAASAGASTINLHGDLVTGRLISGDILTIAGDAQAYTVTGQVISPTTANTLTTVPINPALAQSAADAAVVTVTPVAQYPLRALVTSFPQILINGTSVLQSDLRVRLMSDDLVVTPAAGDIVVVGSEQRSVVIADSASAGGVTYAYFLQIRE
jgi:hypothetical protein